MTVVSTKEFNANQEKYFDMALSEEIFVRRNDVMFIVTRANDKQKKYLAPDDDLRNAISIDELRESAHNHIHKLFAKQ